MCFCLCLRVNLHLDIPGSWAASVNASHSRAIWGAKKTSARRSGEVVKFECRLGTPTLSSLDANSEQPKAGVEEQPETKGDLQGGANTGRLPPNFMPRLFDPVRRLFFVTARRNLPDVRYR